MVLRRENKRKENVRRENEGLGVEWEEDEFLGDEDPRWWFQT